MFLQNGLVNRIIESRVIKNGQRTISCPLPVLFFLHPCDTFYFHTITETTLLHSIFNNLLYGCNIKFYCGAVLQLHHAALACFFLLAQLVRSSPFQRAHLLQCIYGPVNRRHSDSRIFPGCQDINFFTAGASFCQDNIDQNFSLSGDSKALFPKAFQNQIFFQCSHRLWQHPPQWLQSCPHCKDFPAFLSLTMLRMASPTPPASKRSTTAVPIIPAPPFLMLLFLLKRF